MIPDHFFHAASPQQQVKLLLSTLGLPPDVESALRQVLLEPSALPPAGGEINLGGGWRLEGNKAGGAVLLQQTPGAPPRRWAYADAWGQLHGLLRWEVTGGRLRGMALRLPGGAWMEVHPRSSEHGLWGDSDRLILRGGNAAQRLASFEAVDYGCISHLPPLDFPGALPPGAGEALLNTLAMLLHDQGREAVAYRGPYPTEQLFHSLQRSFQCLLPEQEALTTFVRDEFALALSGEMVESPVAWRPSPFAPTAPEPDLLAIVRDGVEGVWLGASPFRRGPSGGARVWPEQSGREEVYRVGLILLGAPYRIYCTLDPKGGLLNWQDRDGARETEQEARPAATLYPGARPAAPLYHGSRPAAPLWREAVFAWAAYNSAPALAPSITALAPRISVAWAELPHALAAMRDDRLLLQAGALLQFDRLRDGRRDHALGMMLISDVLSGATPALRRRAQTELAETSEPDLAALNQQGELAHEAAGQTLKKAIPGILQSLLQK